MSPWLIALLVFMALITIVNIVYKTSSRIQQWVYWVKSNFNNEDGIIKASTKKAIYWVMAAVGKMVWKWRLAPNGSLQKLGWNVFLLVAISLGLWIIVCFIDKRINGSQPDYSKAINAAPGEKVG